MSIALEESGAEVGPVPLFCRHRQDYRAIAEIFFFGKIKQ